MNKILFTLLAALSLSLGVQAQEAGGQRRLVEPEQVSFRPHWYLTLQGGAAYDAGEAGFSKLLSPAAQVSLGYRFAKPFALRLATAGWRARGSYVYPAVEYKWKFVRPSLDFVADLSTLLAGWNPRRAFNAYALIGGGAAYAFANNDVEAVLAGNDPRMPEAFAKAWTGHRWHAVARGGLGADIRLSDFVAINIEANADMMPDHWNSKTGKGGSPDWRFNALAGLKINLGRGYRKTEAVYEYIEPEPVRQVQKEPRPEEQPATEPQPEAKAEPMTANVYFVIGRSDIRKSQEAELDRLVLYLAGHPEAKVQLTGYADKETGTPRINLRLSRERAAAVKEYLVNKGVPIDRVDTEFKGDTVQPYPTAQENRVTIAITY